MQVVDQLLKHLMEQNELMVTQEKLRFLGNRTWDLLGQAVLTTRKQQGRWKLFNSMWMR